MILSASARVFECMSVCSLAERNEWCSILQIKQSVWRDYAIHEVWQQLGVADVGSEVQERALFALFLLCQGSREVKALLISHGVIEGTARAMEQACFDSSLTARAVAFIYVLVIEPQGRREVVERGGAAALIRGLQRKMTDENVVGLALRALVFLAPQVRSPMSGVPEPVFSLESLAFST